MVVRDGRVVPELSQTGPLASGVPGALAAYDKLLRQAGRRDLAELLRPAARQAEQGFFVDPSLAQNLRESAATLGQFAGARDIFLKADGQPYQEGERLVQPDLARTYRAIADHGPSWFYEGPFATDTEEWMAKNGGIITAADLRRYKALTRSPIVTTYRGYTIVGFPPPSSGGIHVAQILNILECFDLAALHRESEATLMHVVAEAMKLALADRAYWLGDADFVNVPRGLIDKEYGKQLASRIDLHHASDVPSHGLPPNWQKDLFGGHTTHIAAVDAEGSWVAITATLNTAFGSKVVIPGTGVTWNDQMDDFSTQPGVPNVFGLVGAENNAIAAGKRPLSSMSPTIVLKDGQPVLTLGGAGGPKIITEVVLSIIRWVDLQWPLEDCVAQPRWHHQWRPDRLFVEDSVPNLLRIQLQGRGHVVEQLESGIVQAIARMPDGQFHGVHDPRVPGLAAGW
jgi:gamma-glutamyltranspeptidase/glutathione hydrolase